MYSVGPDFSDDNGSTELARENYVQGEYWSVFDNKDYVFFLEADAHDKVYKRPHPDSGDEIWDE